MRVGQGNKLEIWDEQAWSAWRDTLLTADDESEPLTDLGALAL